MELVPEVLWGLFWVALRSLEIWGLNCKCFHELLPLLHASAFWEISFWDVWGSARLRSGVSWHAFCFARSYVKLCKGFLTCARVESNPLILDCRETHQSLFPQHYEKLGFTGIFPP